jgi:protein-S-isoprenylcysteine O-methyltransferase Ste14
MIALDSDLVWKSVFATLFWLRFLVQFYFGRTQQLNKRVWSWDKESRDREGRGTTIAGVAFFCLQIGFFAVYVANPVWLRRFVLPLPHWLRWSGLCLGVLSLSLLIWIHRVLGQQWSPYLKIQEDHRLVTDGPYRWVRHPMYSALFGWMVSVGLIAANWIFLLILAGAWLAIRGRIPREEAMLRKHFRDQYLAYESKTGRLLPRF